MNQTEATHVVAYLNAGFPRDTLEPESFAIWVGEIMELPSAESGLTAAKACVRGGDRFPSIKEFRTAYRQAFDRHIAGRELPAAEGKWVPPPEEFRLLMGKTLRSIDDIPVTDSIVPRPVWARYQRRRELAYLTVGTDAAIQISPPTDEEKHDAILVLRDWCAMGPDDYVMGDETLVVVEAQRIMDEAS